MQNLAFIFVGFFALALCSCQGSSYSSSGIAALASNSNDLLNDKSTMRVFVNNSTGWTLVTELNTSINQAKLPTAVYAGTYGNREDPTVPQPNNLILRVYNPPVAGKDFYYETMILSPTYDVSNTTTVLSWILQYGFSPSQFYVSKELWDASIQGLELSCEDCRNKTNTALLNSVLGQNQFLSKLETALQSQNPGLNLHWSGWQEPVPIVAVQNPVVNEANFTSFTAAENDEIKIKLVFVDPLSSTTPIFPDSWIHYYKATTIETQYTQDFNSRLSYDSDGLNVFVATLARPEGTQTFTYNVQVNNTDRPPAWQSNVLISTAANRLNQVDLSPYCSDPDAGTVLTYKLISGPSGLAISSDGKLTWKPVQTQSGNSDVGDHQVLVNCTDNDPQLKSASTAITVRVLPDSLPTFVSFPTSWSLSEGLEGTIDINVNDIEGDPTLVDVTSVQVISGLPVGSGSFRVSKVTTGNTSQFRIYFTPSYLQAIGGDSTFEIKVSAHYDGSGGVYDPVSSIVSRTLMVSVHNTDDPPQWTLQPADQDVTEAAAFANFSGGSAFDPAPNPTAIKYALDTPSSPDCQWADLNVNQTTGKISGTPDYTSPRFCQFRIAATDAKGLTSYSAYATYTVANVDRPVTVRPDATTSYTVQERNILTFSLLEIFADQDIADGDSFDRINYLCTNCFSLGVNGFTLSATTNTATYIPPVGMSDNSPYDLQIQATDVGGYVVTATVRIIVNRGPRPVNVALSTTAFTVPENLSTTTSYPITLTVTPNSSDAADLYGYRIANPIGCVKSGGGSCRAAFITAPGVLTGDGNNGSTDFTFSVQPNSTDGDNPLPATSRNYTLSFQVFKADDPTLFVDRSVSVTVNNVNQAPNAIGVGLMGTATGPYTYGSTRFTLPTIDVSKDKKLGSQWQSIYKVPVNATDPDGANDTLTYSLVETAAPGTIDTNGLWTFKLPSCLAAGTNQVSKTYTLKVEDGRGGSLARQVYLTLKNITLPPPSCL